jgi:hypothetical protein
MKIASGMERTYAMAVRFDSAEQRDEPMCLRRDGQGDTFGAIRNEMRSFQPGQKVSP